MYFAPLSTFLLVPILGLLSLATPFMISMEFHTSLEFAPVDHAAILPGEAVSRKTCCKRAEELGFSKTFGASH